MNQEWSRYNPQPFHDELMVACQESRPHSRKLVEYLQNLSRADFCHRVDESERVIREMGITFTIYSDAGNIDRAWPFDIIPRAISGSEWSRTEKGLKQRIRALNMFIQDVYNERRAIR
ncbi:MAG TPA: circularly permuted type 2 ATP-grasp protein, partial [Thiolinea sp.]|nr:circularly permuted type 2 ATP-grasp protein [Thiolinea sp.]